MAMHDVDKNSGQRLNPEPNANDKVNQRLAHGTTQIQNKRDDSNTGSVRILESQIVVNDGTTDRVLIGYLKNGF